ncbi:MAG: restriction endonuclease [Candidatus Nitrosocaldus sp.]
MPSMIIDIIPSSYLELFQYAILIPIILIALTVLLAVRIHRRRKSKERIRRLTIERLRSMQPKEFEYTVADILRAMEYKDVRIVGGSGDLAVDITARHGKDKVVVQCKRYTSKKVTSPEMQMFIGMMLTEYNARKGIYVTTSSFTQDAIELARRHGIELWDGNTLAEMVSRLG